MAVGLLTSQDPKDRPVGRTRYAKRETGREEGLRAKDIGRPAGTVASNSTCLDLGDGILESSREQHARYVEQSGWPFTRQP